ncbi:MAG TPA: DivIVA domain-containing protein [Firmicutes bacterium]|jgi:cell division initiation protein|nr:DivIVA domain-containing protein [Bacillota bacterium]
MSLTPLDIEKKEFKRTFRGYSEEEVDEFLDLIVQDYETLYRENLDLKDKNQNLKEQLEQYQRLEDTLKNTLLMAQQTAEEAKNNAHREVEIILKEARERAAGIIAEAEEQFQATLQQFQQKKQELRVFQSKIKTLLEAQMELILELEKELKQ